MPVRTASAVWEGNLREGKGTMRVGSGAFEGKYSYGSRFEDAGGTNPEELIGAAHAGCFSMALASGLTRAGFSPQSIHTTAHVHLERVDNANLITSIDLNTEARVTGIDAQQFQQQAESAKNNCPVSRALTGVTINLTARLLEDRDGVTRHIHVIINPAAGQDQPVLQILNRAFKDSDIEWDVSLTKGAGDARDKARELAKGGVDLVAVYGGDGTIMEAAEGLMESEVPLAILPGGTANAVALALNIPTELEQAAGLIKDGGGQVRRLDMGRLDQRCFLVAVGIGIPGKLAENADRESKDRLGALAYGVATVDALRTAEVARYHLTLDGQEVVEEGVACAILNSGNFGIRGVVISPDIDMADGLLDVIVIPSAGLVTILSAAATLAASAVSPAARPSFPHWKVREVSVVADPLQPIQADGEILEPSAVHVKVLPGAVSILTPKAADS